MLIAQCRRIHDEQYMKVNGISLDSCCLQVCFSNILQDNKRNQLVVMVCSVLALFWKWRPWNDRSASRFIHLQPQESLLMILDISSDIQNTFKDINVNTWGHMCMLFCLYVRVDFSFIEIQHRPDSKMLYRDIQRHVNTFKFADDISDCWTLCPSDFSVMRDKHIQIKNNMDFGLQRANNLHWFNFWSSDPWLSFA